MHLGRVFIYASLFYPLLIHFYGLCDLAFLTSLSPLYQLRSIPPVTRTRSISAANTANLLNRNAWRPNCFSFEALRPSPRSQMGPCPLPSSHHFLLFATRTIPRARFHLARPARVRCPRTSSCPSFLLRFVWRTIFCISKCTLIISIFIVIFYILYSLF